MPTHILKSKQLALHSFLILWSGYLIQHHLLKSQWVYTVLWVSKLWDSMDNLFSEKKRNFLETSSFLLMPGFGSPRGSPSRTQSVAQPLSSIWTTTDEPTDRTSLVPANLSSGLSSLLGWLPQNLFLALDPQTNSALKPWNRCPIELLPRFRIRRLRFPQVVAVRHPGTSQSHSPYLVFRARSPLSSFLGQTVTRAEA